MLGAKVERAETAMVIEWMRVVVEEEEALAIYLVAQQYRGQYL
jgi:hypothetical protein